MTLRFTKQLKTNIESVKKMKNSQDKAIILYLGLKKQSTQILNSSWENSCHKWDEGRREKKRREGGGEEMEEGRIGVMEGI